MAGHLTPTTSAPVKRDINPGAEFTASAWGLTSIHEDGLRYGRHEALAACLQECRKQVEFLQQGGTTGVRPRTALEIEQALLELQKEWTKT